jgi:hypothetical protein
MCHRKINILLILDLMFLCLMLKKRYFDVYWVKKREVMEYVLTTIFLNLMLQDLIYVFVPKHVMLDSCV